MLTGSPEQLKQPLAEAVKPAASLSHAEAARGEIAEAAGKIEATSEKMDQRLGVPEHVEQSFSDRAKEVAGTLSAESKGFVAKLYERVKSSEIAQNITDRYQVWRSEGLAGRAQRNIEKFQNQQKMEQDASVNALERAKAVEATQAKMDEVIQSIGKERSAEDKAKGQEEITGLKTKAEEAEMRAQLLAGQMSQEKERLENYQARVQEARGHLDGRLAAKQEQNNKILEQYDVRKKNLEAVVENLQEQVKENESHIKTLEDSLAAAAGESARVELQKFINEFRTKQKVLAQSIHDRIDSRDNLQEKTEKLKEKNADWQAKRDAIFPPKEKPAKVEQPGETPKSIEIKPDGKKAVVDFGGGKEVIVSGGQVSEIGPNGSITIKPISDMSDDMKRYFGDIPRYELEMMGFQASEIEGLQQAKEEKPRFLARDLVAAWNIWYRKAHRQDGAVIRLEKGADPAADLQNQDAGKEFIMNSLAKKFGKTTKELNPGFAKQVDEFFKAREAASVAA